MQKTLIFMMVVALSGCSLSDSKKDVPAVRSDDLEFAVDIIDDQVAPTEDINVKPESIAEAKIPDEYQAPPVEEVAITEPQEPKFEEFSQPNTQVTQVPQEIVITPTVAPVHREVAMTGNYEIYKVQKGDTLMLVAFKIYGDYRKWKDLEEWNKDKLKSKISEGTELKYYIPEEKFGWEPIGLPHLVKTGETLQVISMDKYGTTRKWKSIYENNRPVIRNPNLIFAGFTLYYQPTRELASEPR